jgi:hypothetical protein
MKSDIGERFEKYVVLAGDRSLNGNYLQGLLDERYAGLGDGDGGDLEQQVIANTQNIENNTTQIFNNTTSTTVNETNISVNSTSIVNTNARFESGTASITFSGTSNIIFSLTVMDGCWTRLDDIVTVNVRGVATPVASVSNAFFTFEITGLPYPVFTDVPCFFGRSIAFGPAAARSTTAIPSLATSSVVTFDGARVNGGNGDLQIFDLVLTYQRD